MLDTTTNFDNCTKDQVNYFYNLALTEQTQLSGGNIIAADKAVHTMYPALFQRMNALSASAIGLEGGTPLPSIGPAERAKVVNSTPTPENFAALGLGKDATFDEFQAAANGAGDISQPDFLGAFNSLSTKLSGVRRSTNQSDSAVTSRHPILAQRAKAQVALSAWKKNQPEANGGFQKVPEFPGSAPAPTFGAGGAGSDFPNKSRTGLGFLNPNNYT